MSLDQFGLRADLFRRWFVGEDPGGRELRAFVESHPHPNALAVPALVGAVAIVMGSVPLTFIGLAVLALVVEVVLVVLLARRVVREWARSPGDAEVAALAAGIGWGDPSRSRATGGRSATLRALCALCGGA